MYKSGRDADKAAFECKMGEESSQLKKVKEEVFKHPDQCIRWRVQNNAGGLTNKDPLVWSLLAFSKDAIGYTTQILAMIEWGTIHWQLGEPV